MDQRERNLIPRDHVPFDFIGVRETFARIMSRPFVHDEFYLICQKLNNSIYIMDKKVYGTPYNRYQPQTQINGNPNQYIQSSNVAIPSSSYQYQPNQHQPNQYIQLDRRTGSGHNRPTRPDPQYSHRYNFAKNKLKYYLTEYYNGNDEDAIGAFAGKIFNCVYHHEIHAPREVGVNNSYKILYNGEIDAIESKNYEPKFVKNCALFKLQNLPYCPRKKEKVYTESWSSAYLSGINNVFFTIHNDDFIVQSIERRHLSELSQIGNIYGHSDRSVKCLNSLYYALDHIYHLMMEVEDRQIYEFHYERINDTKLRALKILENGRKLLPTTLK